MKLCFECDWLIELSDNNLASELVENGSFLNQLQSRIIIFIIIIIIIIIIIMIIITIKIIMKFMIKFMLSAHATESAAIFQQIPWFLCTIFCHLLGRISAAGMKIWSI